MNKSGWKDFFDHHAPRYMEESFTTNTLFEVDFLEAELGLAKGARILDVGCGTGRHSLELSRRGYRPTGLDISDGMLREARSICEAEGLEAEFARGDATDFHFDEGFDACICICEGAFGLLSADDDPFTRDQKILDNIFRALKPGGRFILTALNGLRMIRQYTQEDVEAGRFDPLGVVEVYPLAKLFPEAPEGVLIKEKGFLATELQLMMRISGFEVESIYGGTAGAWSRQTVQLDEMELMVIGRKREGKD